MKKFSARFIIKTIGDNAFSENSAFKDILYIADKHTPNSNDHTALVTLKKPIKKMQTDDVTNLCTELRAAYNKRSDVDCDTYEVKFVKTQDLCNYSTNLMPLLGFKSQENGRMIRSFIETIRKKTTKLTKIKGDMMKEGLHASPAGFSKLVFITRPIIGARVSRAFMVLRKTNTKSITIEIRDTGKMYKIPLQYTKPAFRTLTGVKKINADNVDYVLVQEPKGFQEIMVMVNWEKDFDWFTHNKNVQQKSSHIIVSNRFRPDSKNTHHLAYYSKRKVVAPHTFKTIEFGNSTNALIQALFLNSSITMANFLLYRSQSTQGFTNIMEADWIQFDIFKIENLNDDDRNRLLSLYEKLQDVDFPSLKEQFLTNNHYRRELDSTILEILDFDQDKINSTLDKLYKIIVDEFSVD